MNDEHEIRGVSATDETAIDEPTSWNADRLLGGVGFRRDGTWIDHLLERAPGSDRGGLRPQRLASRLVTNRSHRIRNVGTVSRW